MNPFYIPAFALTFVDKKISTMKKLISFSLLFAVLFATLSCSAQEDKSKRPSPPAKLTATINDARIVIDYSQPSVKGRTIGKEIAPYGEVWRTGANEATTFEVSRDVKIEGRELKAGKYGLFTIPAENEWTIIFNKEPNQWGAFKYDKSKDILRVPVKPTKAKSFTEQMTFVQNGNKIALLWGDTEVDFMVQ
jgi:hypothetical protein